MREVKCGMDFEKLLRSFGIDLYAAIPLSRCAIKSPRTLGRAGMQNGSALMLAVPYRCGGEPDGDISLYARAPDYHIFFDEFFAQAVDMLSRERPGASFRGYADASPLYEVPSAARAGLGVISAHGLLITQKYSSFVFLGEIITDMPASDWDELASPLAIGLPRCPGADVCGACARACPGGCIPSGVQASASGAQASASDALASDKTPAYGDAPVSASASDKAPAIDKSRCISALTQKKGDLTPAEAELVRRAGYAWGCDECQLACPLTKAAVAAGILATPIPFFRRLIVPSSSAALALDDSDYSRRAYSWRPRAVLERNAELLRK